MRKDKLFSKTCEFLQQTKAKAQIIRNRYDTLETSLGAYELDYENFILAITNVCADYDHILPD